MVGDPKFNKVALQSVIDSSGTYTVALKGNSKVDFFEENMNRLSPETIKIFKTSPNETDILNAFQKNRVIYMDMDVFDATKLSFLCDGLKNNQATFFGGYEKIENIKQIEKCRKDILYMETGKLDVPLSYLVILFLVPVTGISMCLVVCISLGKRNSRSKILNDEFQTECRLKYESKGVFIEYFPFGLYFEVGFDSSRAYETGPNEIESIPMEFAIQRNFQYIAPFDRKFSEFQIAKEDYIETTGNLYKLMFPLVLGSVLLFMCTIFLFLGTLGLASKVKLIF